MAIELLISEPIPHECNCSWQFHPKEGTKTIKVFNADCGVAEHVKARRESTIDVFPSSEIPTEKRGRGRPRNETGQWHKKRTA